MGIVEQVHIFGFTNIHTFGPNISLIKLFSLILNYAKPRLLDLYSIRDAFAFAAKEKHLQSTLCHTAFSSSLPN